MAGINQSSRRYLLLQAGKTLLYFKLITAIHIRTAVAAIIKKCVSGNQNTAPVVCDSPSRIKRSAAGC